jgi:hypothetical protein
MKRFITFTAVVTVLAALAGCSRAVTGGYKDSPDGKYRCWMRQFGPYNYALRKRYAIRIRVVEVMDKTNWVEKPLFTKEYQFKNPDVLIDPSWDKEDNLRIVLYDYAAGVSWEAAKRAGLASNVIATVSLVMDRKTGTYHEQR